MVSTLHATGGGRLTAVWCVDGRGDTLMPCGRCRQLLWENGTADTLLQTPEGILTMREVLPQAFGPDDLATRRPDRRPSAGRQISTTSWSRGGGPGAFWSALPACHDGRMTEAFDAVDVIVHKRDRRELSDDEIRWVVDAYTRGVVAEEQMSSLAMAILLNGMTRREISTWTTAMIASGERMDFSGLSRPTADKHSTGGVGDKITLPLAPLVAVFDVAVPQLSGRGLGHTGGTLDKLESVAGWQAGLTNEAMMRQLDDVGAVICAAGSGLAPPTRSSTRCATSPARSRPSRSSRRRS